MNVNNLIIELGTEELPPKMLKQLAQSLSDGIEKQLSASSLEHGKVSWLASPRRLAVKVENLAEYQPDINLEKRGPAIAQAFTAEGEPTKAALGWARGCGIDISEADRLVTEKGEWLLHKSFQAGKNLKALLQDIIETAVKQLPIPKPMKWGSETVEFIRPVHTLMVLWGEQVIPAKVLGVESNNLSQGHRFHHNSLVSINHADDYEAELMKAYVVVNYENRKQMILEQVDKICTENQARPDLNEALLDEVVSLVEWPVALVGTFEERFLEVPQEALIYTMKDDQKYFPMLNKDNKLLPKFIFIANIESKDPKQVIQGNEKVVRPRLADAEFFYNSDKKQSLESRLFSLESVLFQKQLGTLKDKSQRISELAGYIAEKLNADVAESKRAGLLSKTDLMTQVVMEFTDIQGAMGKYYALNDGESEIVADALYEQYLPKFSGDKLPQRLESCAVALADKFDSLVGIIGIGQHPKGDKDPFALRRAAIGSIRILIEKQIDLDIKQLAEKAQALFADKLSNQNAVEDVIAFMLARFRNYYQEQGIAIELIRAVEVKQPTSAMDFDLRLKAVIAFAELDDAQALASANKRVNNILNKNLENKSEILSYNKTLLTEPTEIQLVAEIEALAPKVQEYFAKGDYVAGLIELSKLRQAIDAFFENVMVMADDMAVRNNRFAILQKIQTLFMETADISVL